MKVKISETLDVTEDQRVQLADLLDAKESRRQATRDECKSFIWLHGEHWGDALNSQWVANFAPEPGDDDDDDDDDILGLGTPAPAEDDEDDVL